MSIDSALARDIMKKYLIVPVAVARHIEDALHTDGDKMTVTDEELVNGKWHRKVHYEPMPN
jgi:hypothetical protein